METATQLLQVAAFSGAIYCGLAYFYAFVLKPKGDRRFHVMSLFFTGMALLALSAMIPSVATTGALFAAGAATVCLLVSIGCQSFAAFRGRKGDRRVSDRTADDKAVDERATEATAKPKVRLVAGKDAKAA